MDVNLFIIITNVESQEMQIHFFFHHALVKVPPHHMQVELLLIQSWWSNKFSFKFSGKIGRSDLCSSTSNQHNACFFQQTCNSKCTLTLMSVDNICQERILCEDKFPTSQNKDHVPKCTFYNPVLCVFYEKEKLPLFTNNFCITFVCFSSIFWLCVMQEDMTPLIDSLLASPFHEFPRIHILTKLFFLTYTICESKCTSLLW